MPEPEIDDVRAAFPEWMICADSAGIWHARLTTSEQRPQPRLAAATLGELARLLNDYLAGEDG
jgi:hypothetical protein